MIDADLAEEIQGLAAAYERVRVGGSEMLHRRSTTEHVADLADLAVAAGLEVVEPLRRLAGRLQRVGP